MELRKGAVPVVKAFEGFSEIGTAGPNGHSTEAWTGPVDVSFGCDESHGCVARIILQLYCGSGWVRVLFGQEDNLVLALLFAVRHLDHKAIATYVVASQTPILSESFEFTLTHSDALHSSGPMFTSYRNLDIAHDSHELE